MNTSSTADISFMLLIFFLVTSSMDAGKGLRRQLPPPPQDEEQVADIRREDIMTVVLTADGQLTMNGDTVALEQLQQEVTRFAAVNPKHRVIAIKAAPEAKYNDYFQLQNALVAAYRPLKCAPRVSEVIEERGESEVIEERGERRVESEKGGEP